MNIVTSRLQSQHLLGEPFESVDAVVAHFGAVQSQDYLAATWALSLRLASSTKADIDLAFNEGRILRTHVLRPTWHFVLPEDIRWMVKLTAPRIKQAMAYYNRKLDLDDAFFVKSHSVISAALAKEHEMTRTELAQRLAGKRIKASGQRLAHIVMQAEIDGLICSGSLHGKQFTYALIDERAPNAKELGREESLALLAKKYFTSHGPATLQDFTWWSGLTVADSRLGLELSRRELQSEDAGEKRYWFKENTTKQSLKPHILLLSVYDEYVIAYKDYSPIFIDQTKNLTGIFGNARLDYVVVKDGLVVGTWRRINEAKEVKIKTNVEVSLGARDHKLLKMAARDYSRFLSVPVDVTFV